MSWLKKYALWLLILLGNSLAVTAQTDSVTLTTDSTRKSPSPVAPGDFWPDSIPIPPEESSYIIRHIYIEGNKITRRAIMLRELPFKEDDVVKIKISLTCFPAEKHSY